jgi:thioester reductase-like protein
VNYFVTGATGFIGRHLVAELLKRDGTIYALVREGSRGKLDSLVQRLGADDEIDGGEVLPGFRMRVRDLLDPRAR